MTKFDNVTESARRALFLSVELAREHNSSNVDTAHILLGLIVESGNVGVLFDRLDINPHEVQTAVESIIERSNTPVTGDLNLTFKAKRVIEVGAEEVGRFGHDYIGVLHLLLGVLQDERVAPILERFGLTLAIARSETLAILKSVTVNLPTALIDRLQARCKAEQDITDVIEELLDIAEREPPK